MGNNCCSTEELRDNRLDSISLCNSVEEIIDLLKNDINILRKIEKTMILIKNNQVEELKAKDKIYLEYQVRKRYLY